MSEKNNGLTYRKSLYEEVSNKQKVLQCIFLWGLQHYLVAFIRLHICKNNVLHLITLARYNIYIAKNQCLNKQKHAKSRMINNMTFSLVLKIKTVSTV